MNVRSNLQAGAACYTVKSGDSLSTISMRFYGDASPAHVNLIYYSNRRTIGPNPNYIVPGAKLYIPD